MTPYSMPPVAVPPSPPRRGPSPLVHALLGAVIGASLVVGGGAGTIAIRAKSAAREAAKDTGGANAVVRVVSGRGHGTGFFVSGPDEGVYVVTAYHVVKDGGALAVERAIDGAGVTSTEAYPETALVAFDSEADLAVLRVKGVTRERFPRMALATDVRKDEDVLSYGFPGSSLARRFGMVSKPGKVLSLVRFPARDHRTKAMLRMEAVPGLLVSAEIEHGFSGGPLVNARGEVVGVNVTKDLAQRAQNGAVSVAALRELLAKVRPLREEKPPTPDEVKNLLVRLERDYLLLPVERRLQTPEEDVVSEEDIPEVRELADDLRTSAGEVAASATTKMSKRAATGFVMLAAPGHPLEAFLSSTTKSALDACEARNKQLSRMLGTSPLAADDEHDCSDLAVRPLAWDLAAMAVQWEGKERTIAVSKVEAVDDGERLYRAQVRFSGSPNVADVWLRAGGGRLRLALFDLHGKPSGLETALATTAPASSFQGTWARDEARVPRDFGEHLDAEVEGDESLTVAVAADNVVAITHRVRRRVHFTGGARLACGGSSLDLGLEQTFAGKLENGRVIAIAQKPPRPLGADMARCWRAFTYEPDTVVMLKPRGDKLVMVRTSKAAFPESAELERR